MKIGIVKETLTGENRVAIVPRDVKKYCELGFEVLIESQAGLNAQFPDAAYTTAGAALVADATTVWQKADIIFKVHPPTPSECELMHAGQILAGFFWPLKNESTLKTLNDKKITVIALDRVPRISRAQKMDALSSMANLGGYRAVVEAAHYFGKFFTGQSTAAGRIPPAKVMVIGAGVAGLACMGAAKAMGAIVRAFDTRPAVKDQVISLGAEFLELEFDEDGTGEGGYAKVMSQEFIDAEMKLFAAQCKEIDIIITTALIPGRPAPELITEEMVRSMKAGSVIVDLAAEQGGNCALTEPGKMVVKHGVKIIGFTDLPSRMPEQASQLYSANLFHLMSDISKDGHCQLNLDDQVFWNATIAHDGVCRWPTPEPPDHLKPKQAQDGGVASKKPVPTPVPAVKKQSSLPKYFMAAVFAVVFFALAKYAPPDFLSHFTVFVLACFIGWQVIWNVKPALHTPLMSVTNAISGIIVIGAMVQLSNASSAIVTALAVAGIFLATINISGGFLVTQRMLRMFRK